MHQRVLCIQRTMKKFISVILISSIYIVTLVRSVLLLDSNLILKVTDHLQINKPIIYDYDDFLNINAKSKLYRKLFLNYQSASFNSINNEEQINFQDKQTFVVLCSTLQNFTWKFFGDSIVLVVSNIKNETDLENLSETIAINAQVYFLDYNSSKLYEAYTINNYKITKFLGLYNARMASRGCCLRALCMVF